MSMAEPVSDKEYQARWDAETLAQAESIKDDPSRLTAAQSAAKALADKQSEDAKSMRKVAGKSANRDPAPSPNQGYQPPKTTAKPAPKKSGGYNVFQKI